MHHLSGFGFFVLESWRVKTIGVIKMNKATQAANHLDFSSFARLQFQNNI